MKTTVNGVPILLLECGMRFEMSAYSQADHAFIHGGRCKRVAAAPADAPNQSIIYVVRPDSDSPTLEYTDSFMLTDSDGEDWVRTELAWICPGCLEAQSDTARVVWGRGINPFTEQRFQLSEFVSEDDFGYTVDPPQSTVFRVPVKRPTRYL